MCQFVNILIFKSLLMEDVIYNFHDMIIVSRKIN